MEISTYGKNAIKARKTRNRMYPGSSTLPLYAHVVVTISESEMVICANLIYLLWMQGAQSPHNQSPPARISQERQRSSYPRGKFYVSLPRLSKYEQNGSRLCTMPARLSRWVAPVKT